MSLGKSYFNQCRRELLLQVRQPKSVLFTALFFVMITVFFPLTISPDPHLLKQIAPGVFWIAVLLAFLMASERLFHDEYQDGVIEQWLVSGRSVSILVVAKLSVHWLLNIIPIALLTFVLGALFDLSFYERCVLVGSFIAGTPAMWFLCALASSFCTGLQQKGVLIALVLLPLVVPVMIFGSMSLSAAMQQFPISGYMALLLALSILAVVFLPMAIATIIRISLTD